MPPACCGRVRPDRQLSKQHASIDRSICCHTHAARTAGREPAAAPRLSVTVTTGCSSEFLPRRPATVSAWQTRLRASQQLLLPAAPRASFSFFLPRLESSLAWTPILGCPGAALVALCKIFERHLSTFAQNKLQNSFVNHETNLMSLINPSLEVVYYSITITI